MHPLHPQMFSRVPPGESRSGKSADVELVGSRFEELSNKVNVQRYLSGPVRLVSLPAVFVYG